MVILRQGVRPEEVRQSAKHILFVEGKDHDVIDPIVLRILLEGKIRIEPLGPSFHIKSAAQALVSHHPDYYFLIDRDHRNNTFIKQCWDEFPNPNTYNLLVWPCREIENYFLIPEYLLKSQYLNVSETDLRNCILEDCQKRLYLDTVNQVIISIREKFKEKWVEIFKNPAKFKTKEKAIENLFQVSDFLKYKEKVSNNIKKEKLEKHFNKILDEYTGSKETLEYGCGKWIELSKGKKILPTVINRCFKVYDMQKKELRGNEKLNEVVKDLIRLPLDEQPKDFQRLHKVIMGRIST